MLRVDNQKIVLCALRGVLRIILGIYSFFLKNNTVYCCFIIGVVLMNAGNFCFAYLPVPIIFYPLVMLLNVVVILCSLFLIIGPILLHPEHEHTVADFAGKDFMTAHFGDVFREMN